MSMHPNLSSSRKAANICGQRLELVDGGSVNWTQKFLSSAKERLIMSGIGSERLCGEFGSAAETE
jgi:hypothetical protein